MYFIITRHKLNLAHPSIITIKLPSLKKKSDINFSEETDTFSAAYNKFNILITKG